MKNMKSLLLLCFLFQMINLYKLEEDEYYFQLYPHEDKTQPNLFHFYNLKPVFYTWNSTEGDIQEINEAEKIDEIPIKRLSSVISVGDFIIKTCFNPNKIIEIIDENKNILTPTDDYFKKVRDNLENIEYCYSTPIVNPYNTSEYVIVTYWTENNTQISGKTKYEKYEHKSILFYPSTKTFSKIYPLNTNGESYFAQSCTNLRNMYIYCNIDKSFPLFRMHHFSIYPSLNSTKEIEMKIKLVNVYYIFSYTNYYRPIGINRYLYTKNGQYVNYFLTEIHDEQHNKTQLMTSYYYHLDSRSIMHRNEYEETYYGINIEDTFIDQNLFNYILPSEEELIIIYITKGSKGENLLLLNRYNYTTDLTKKTKFDKYSSSNYLRDDICENPKYMQSIHVNSFIKYDERDQEYIRNNPNQTFYTYQRDIATIISCDNGNNNVFYQAKKIQMPQCINTLNKINGVKSPFIFTKDNTKINLNLYENPNYKSLRNVKIEFFNSKLYENTVIVRAFKDGEAPKVLLNAGIIDLSDIKILEFTKMPFFRKGKTIQFPYRIIKTEERDNSISCHLSSDICYLEFYYQGEENSDNPENTECPFCNIIGNNTCSSCDEITAIKKIDNDCGCECDENNGFNKEPNIYIDMCICKNGYSFYKDIYQCLPDTILKNGSFCIQRRDEKSLINIYIDLRIGGSICYENGLPMCCEKIHNYCEREEWFKLGTNIFYSYKIGKCVYITYNNSIVMYSKKSDCGYKETDEYKECLKININNERDYNNALDKAYEYNLEDNNNSLIINSTNDKEKITFYLLNNYTESKNLSSVDASTACIEKIKKEKNLDKILIFITSIKRPQYISTQVEYSFYNPIPEYINENINMSLYCSKPKNNLHKRELEVADEWKNNNNVTADIDEVIINVQIDFNSEQLNNINELRNNNINIFDSASDFYNDPCFMYTTKEKTDIYLQSRREHYYIRDPLCESGCIQIGYDNNTNRIKCKCKIKGSTFENVTFVKNPLNKFFEKKYILPNVRILKCLFKGKKIGFWQILAFIFLILFIFATIKNSCRKLSIAKKTITNDDTDYNDSNYINGTDKIKKFGNDNKINKKKDKYLNKIITYEKKNIIDSDTDNNDKNINNNTFENNIITNDNNGTIHNKKRKKTEKKYEHEIPLDNLMDRLEALEEDLNIHEKHEDVNEIEDPDPEVEEFRTKKQNDENDVSIENPPTTTKPKHNIKNKTNKNELNSDEGSINKNPNNKNKNNKKENNTINTDTNNGTNDNLLNLNKKNSIKEQKDKEKDENKTKTDGHADNKTKDTINKDEENIIDSRTLGAYGAASDKGSENVESEIPKPRKYSSDDSEKKSESNANPPKKEKGETIKIHSKKIPVSSKDKGTSEREMSDKDNKNENNDERNENEKKNLKKEDCQKKYIYKIQKYPDDYNKLNILASKIIRESNLVYLCFPLAKYKNENNTNYHGIYIKLSISILFISCYLCFNLLIEYDLSDLHLVYPKDKYTNKPNLGNWILKLFSPYIVFLIIHYIKNILNLREFYYEEEERISDILKMWGKKKVSKNKFYLIIHDERTRIKKFKINFHNNITIISTLGILFLFCNLIFVCSFFGIYHNSYASVLINVIISIISSFILNIVISIIEFLFSLFNRSCDLKVILFCFYTGFCRTIYCLIYFLSCKKFNEELKEYGDEEYDKINEKKQSNESDSN